MADDDKPDVIWHYTSTAGLLGILDDRGAKQHQERMGRSEGLTRGAFSIRFTDAQYLNDPQEMRYAREVLVKILLNRADELDGDDRVDLDAALGWLRDDPDKVSSRTKDIVTNGTYVACFSEAKDSLSQWSGYAGSRGYAIGFDRNVLKEMWAPLILEVGDTFQKDELVQPLPYEMNYGLESVTEWFNGIAENIINPIVQVPRRQLCELALAYAKDTPYQHEREVRAAVMRGGPTPQVLSFREGKLGVVPYLSVCYLPTKEDDPQLIREIMVGPGDEIQPRQDAVRQLVHERCFDPETEILVTRSGILFRA